MQPRKSPAAAAEPGFIPGLALGYNGWYHWRGRQAARDADRLTRPVQRSAQARRGSNEPDRSSGDDPGADDGERLRRGGGDAPEAHAPRRAGARPRPHGP